MPFQDCCENCICLTACRGLRGCAGSLYVLSETVCIGVHYYKVMFWVFLFALSCFDVGLCKFGSVYLAHEKLPAGQETHVVSCG